MRYIINDCTAPCFNQAFEQVLFDEYTKDDILLLWRNTPCVVFGRYQNVFAEVNIVHAKNAGVDIIRRDTGGGAVYHDLGNINFSLMSQSHGIGVSYDEYLTKAVCALNKIGVPAHTNKTCDIAIDGKKISGNAQRQTKTRVLCHGTLLFNTDLNKLNEFLPDKTKSFSSKAIASNRSEVANISEYVSNFSSAAEFMYAFADAFNAQQMNADNELLSKADQIASEKYRSWEWTIGKNPAFSRTIQSDNIIISFASKNGIITELDINIDDKRLSVSDIFIGKRLEENEIYKQLKENLNNKCADILSELIFDCKTEELIYEKRD